MSTGMSGMNPYSNNRMNPMNNYGPSGMQQGMPGGMQGYGHVNPMSRMPSMHPSMQHPNMNSQMTHHMRSQYMVSINYDIFGDTNP